MGRRGKQPENLVGQRFGKLVVTEMIPGNVSREPMVKCRCDCGIYTLVRTSNLKRGNTKSCGCLHREVLAEKAKERRESNQLPEFRAPYNQTHKMIGQRFGRLVVTDIVERDKHGHAMVECLCDCGERTIVRASLLKNGNTKSCGCGRAISAKKLHTTHGDSGKDSKNRRLYGIWNTMRERCENRNAQYYSDYGGRGISICAEWHQWEPFRDWALANGYADNLTIDRINNDCGYSPDNCRWLTRLQQSNNKRTSLYIQFEGEIHSCADWSRILGIPYSNLYSKVSRLLENARMKEPPHHNVSLPPMEGDYGYLTVIEKDGTDTRGNRMVKCRCICGKVKTYRLSNLKSGKIISCGCMRNLLIAAKQSKHHDSVPESEFYRLYNIWKAMVNRRRTANYTKTELIGIDKSWQNWDEFKKWSLGHGYSDGKRLVRIDNDKPYAPDNCLWVVQGERVFRSMGIVTGHSLQS